MIIKINFGIKEDTVRPYKAGTSSCFLLEIMPSNFTFNITIDEMSPNVNTQNKMLIIVFKVGHTIPDVID